MIYYVFVVKTPYDTRTVMASRRSSVFCLFDIMLMALGIMLMALGIETVMSSQRCMRVPLSIKRYSGSKGLVNNTGDPQGDDISTLIDESIIPDGNSRGYEDFALSRPDADNTTPDFQQKQPGGGRKQRLWTCNSRDNTREFY